MTIFAEFEGHAFPKPSGVKWLGAAPVFHYVYKLRQAKNAEASANGLPDKSLRLFKQWESQHLGKADTVADVAAMAEGIRKGGGLSYPESGAQDVHIKLATQCWLIIEIERRTNWRFARSIDAVTTKKAEDTWPQNGTRGFNADLNYLFDDGKLRTEPNPSDVGPAVDCHIIFFRVMRRVKGLPCGMNFHVELYREREKIGGKPIGKALGLVPLVVDPQVPEDPPESFP